MRWIIDGYNVTRSDPATRDLSLEQQRAALSRRLKVRAVQLLGTSDYVVVWDGAGGFAGKGKSTGSKSTFTRKKTADDSIVSRVRAAKERVGIVTSDSELINRCKGASDKGCDIKSSSSLFEGASGKRVSKRESGMRRDIGIPSNANQINEELKRIWGIE